jgi:hypothetical protein
VVLSPEEVASFLEAVPNRRDRVALTTAYATGLRASEVVGRPGRAGLGRVKRPAVSRRPPCADRQYEIAAPLRAGQDAPEEDVDAIF